MSFFANVSGGAVLHNIGCAAMANQKSIIQIYAIVPTSFISVVFPSHLSNTLALTPFPLRTRFNLWYRPIFVNKEIDVPSTHRDILSFERGYSGPQLLVNIL